MVKAGPLSGRFLSLDKSTSSWPRLRFCADLVLLLVVVVVLAYVIQMVVRINRGYSATEDAPEYIVRLQVLNASGQPRVPGDVLAFIGRCSDRRMRVELVHTDRFELRLVPQSFIIARDEDRTAARLLALRLGFEPDRVVYRQLPDNDKYIDATLVLGADASNLVTRTSKEKEN
jgi:hypothetical protein